MDISVSSYAKAGSVYSLNALRDIKKPSVLKAAEDTPLLKTGAGDSVQLSEAGIRLLAEQKPVSENMNWERLTSTGDDEAVQMIDKHVAIAGQLLSRMNKTAEAAMDEELSDQERMELQELIGKLQHSLNAETAVLTAYSDALTKGEEITEEEAMKAAEKTLEPYETSDGAKILKFASDRLLAGMDWDVPIVKTTGGKENTYKDDAWEALTPEMTKEADLKVNATEVPTVSEILKAKGLSLMNAQDAADSKKEIEKNLGKLVSFRDGFIKYLKQTEEIADQPEVVPAKDPKRLSRELSQLLKQFTKDTVFESYDLAGYQVPDEENLKFTVNGQKSEPNNVTYEPASRGGVNKLRLMPFMPNLISIYA